MSDILEAARAVFESKGFINTTLQDVAKEAEVSVGLIYRYFLSKEDIFAGLALKGAQQFDKDIQQIIAAAQTSRKKPPFAEVLGEIADRFFKFYGPYGEYFDLLLYSYKGKKEVQIRGTTLTRLMSLTLTSLDRIKCLMIESKDIATENEDEALQIVFQLWATLLGCHKLFDSSGRGHLFAFDQKEFVTGIVKNIVDGIGSRAPL